MKRKSNYKKLLSFLLVFTLMLSTSMTTLAAPGESVAEKTAITNDEEGNVDTTKENKEETVTEDSSQKETEVTKEETKDEKIDETKNNNSNAIEEAEKVTLLENSSKEKSLAVNEELKDGINDIIESVSGKTFNIDDGKCININGPSAEKSIEFTNCVFNISGNTFKINGELITKINVSGLVTFNNCKFYINSVEGSTNGNDAVVYLGGNGSKILFNESTIKATDCNAQVIGLYGTANVTFNNSNISTTGNIGHWSYAMYGGSVLNLNNSTMSATGMKRASGGGNINAFYSGDLRTNYDAVNIKDSIVDFSDNNGGGFAINNINIHVDNSTINVNNNAGNATNSGVWYVNDSEITMNGNKGHGFSHIGDEMTNTKLTIKHNGFAGYYLQAFNASLTNCDVDIRCNGERLLSYSAGDVWLNGHTATFNDCKSVWLGGVGRTGEVIANNCPYFVAYDLFENKTKGNTSPVLEGVTLSEQDEHTLFLNPSKEFDYARGDTELKDRNNNDDDLFNDVNKEIAIGKDTAKIGTLTTAQLSHHKYDWENGTVTDNATPDTFGVKAYECIDSCSEHKEWTGTHASSFNCDGTYVYAPLVGLTFDSNAGNDEVNNMPEAQTTINYEDPAIEPSEIPERVSKDNVIYAFTGWYTDKECTNKFDFSTKLTSNWTTLYAGWKEQTSLSVTKVWDDENNKDGIRPDSVTVTLLVNGEETDYTITLNADNNWEGIFVGLDKYANEKEILYTIKETKVEGYTSKITGDAKSGFVITNKHTPKKDEVIPSKPNNTGKDTVNSGTKGITVVKTGDTGSFGYWILLLVGSVTGIGAVGIRRRK